jgi:hypothetical protein
VAKKMLDKVSSIEHAPIPAKKAQMVDVIQKNDASILLFCWRFHLEALHPGIKAVYLPSC